MGRHQAVRQEVQQYASYRRSMVRPIQMAVSSPRASAQRPRQSPQPNQSATTQLLLRLIRHHSFVLLLGTWVLLLLTAGLAVVDMMSPSSSRQPSATSMSSAEPPVVTQAPPQSPDPQSNNGSPVDEPLPLNYGLPRPVSNGENLPALSLLAIALSCTTGCLLLSRQMHRRRSDRHPQPGAVWPSQSNAASPAATPSAQPILPPVIASTSSPKRQSPSFSIAKPQPKPSSTTLIGATPQKATPPSAWVDEAVSKQASVSVVSADQSLPLDWDEPSLADHLDLRQRRPLSYWLQ